MNDRHRPVNRAEAIAYLRTCPYQSLVFDVDDTLYERAEPYGRAYLATFRGRMEKEGGWPAPHRLYELSRPFGEEEYQRRIRGEIDMRDMLVNRTTRTFRACGIEVAPEEALAFEDAYTKAQKDIRLLPEFRDLFEAIAGRVFLGILTNGPAERQWNKVRALGLLRWIPAGHVLVTGEYDVSKPDIASFRLYERMCGVKPEDTLMVGDTLEADILGAEYAGWHSLWILPPSVNR